MSAVSDSVLRLHIDIFRSDKKNKQLLLKNANMMNRESITKL